jgi:hypothetical protein
MRRQSEVYVETLLRREELEALGADGRIILKQLL